MAAGKTKKALNPDYKYLRTWIAEYGTGQMPDQRAVHEYMEIEGREPISSFKTELMAVSQGRFDPKILDNLLKQNRKLKHGSYEQWAKTMLIWMSEYKG